MGVGGWRAAFRLRSVSGVGFGLWQRFYDVIGISPGLGSGLGMPDKQTSVAISARFGTTTNNRGEAQMKDKVQGLGGSQGSESGGRVDRGGFLTRD